MFRFLVVRSVFMGAGLCLATQAFSELFCIVCGNVTRGDHAVVWEGSAYPVHSFSCKSRWENALSSDSLVGIPTPIDAIAYLGRRREGLWSFAEWPARGSGDHEPTRIGGVLGRILGFCRNDIWLLGCSLCMDVAAVAHRGIWYGLSCACGGHGSRSDLADAGKDFK